MNVSHISPPTLKKIQNDYDYLLKILVIGNSNVGKSSLVLRYSDDVFNQVYVPTIGVDFRTKTLIQDECVVKLQIWDTAGQERYRTIVGSYWRGAVGILVLFDLTDRDSFDNLGYWMNEVERSLNLSESFCVLVGTKTDIVEDRVVNYAEAQRFANQKEMLYREVSSKSGDGVAELFQLICKRGLQQIQSKQMKKIGPKYTPDWPSKCKPDCISKPKNNVKNCQC